MSQIAHFDQAQKIFEDRTENKESIQFLFDISNECKYFYETPVIFLTKKDYSDDVFNVMCNVRSLLRGTAGIDQSAVLDIIVEYHLNWLRIIKEINNFKENAQKVPREYIFATVTYSVDIVGERFKYYQRYLTKYRTKLSNEQQSNLLCDIDITEEMCKDVVKSLLDKLLCLRSYLSDHEFLVKINAAVEELCTYVDIIYDNLSMLLCKYISSHETNLISKLSKVLQNIVDEFLKSDSDEAKALKKNLTARRTDTASMIITIVSRYLEMSKIIDKISSLDERIKGLEDETLSAACLALQHKKNYLKERLEFLESKIYERNLSNYSLNIDVDTSCSCKDYYQVRIFNHLLPEKEREMLVTQLLELWNTVVVERVSVSLISIMSDAETTEELKDDFGTYFIDRHGRKIYKVPDDETLYQLNQRNELVPLSDDSEHVYYYDPIGRYFKDPNTKYKVYKETDTASEYMLCETTDTLFKIKEVRGGITYFYDHYGRYYINEDGKHIYREPDSLSEYENDGLGNLVRIKSSMDIFHSCPDDVNVTADFEYLEATVGLALRKCIAKVVMMQPEDPVKYLSQFLRKYKDNMEFQERRRDELVALEAEKAFIAEQERLEAEKAALEAAMLAANEAGSEATYDTNFMRYGDDMATLFSTEP